jgi:hypothetical protein
LSKPAGARAHFAGVRTEIHVANYQGGRRRRLAGLQLEQFGQHLRDRHHCERVLFDQGGALFRSGQGAEWQTMQRTVGR